jgi:BRO family, N-terminal domain
VSDNSGSSSDTSIAVIEEQADRAIRRILLDGCWFFSVIDVVGVLTDSDAPRKYWHAMKQRITEEGFVEASTNCRQLKMTASDGKQRLTDVADTETLLRIIQSIPSPRAEPIKRWLARVGAKHLQETSPNDTRNAASLGSAIAHEWQRRPEETADSLVWAEYLERLAALYRRQAYFESRLEYVEAKTHDQDERLESLLKRVEHLEAGGTMLPELLERLGPERMRPEHQEMVRRWVGELHHHSGLDYSSIYQDLNADFQVERFSDIRESEWEQLESWFRERITSARTPR